MGSSLFLSLSVLNASLTLFDLFNENWLLASVNLSISVFCFNEYLKSKYD